MSKFSNYAIKYFNNLNPPKGLPKNIEIMNPYKNTEVQNVVKKFFNKFFDDRNKRTYIFGINPGRFGGGITGLSFTDPVVLREVLEINNNFGNTRELSSRFVYKLIEEYGGPQKFYSDYFFSAVFPMAIIKNGKNHNYYDSKSLYKRLKPNIINEIKEQIKFGAKTDFAVSLGKKNAGYLKEINDELKIFNEIRTLDHPRYIMQYKSKHLIKYIMKYIKTLQK